MGNKASRLSRKKEAREKPAGTSKPNTKPLTKVDQDLKQKFPKTPKTTGQGKVLGGGGTLEVQDGKTAAAQAAQARLQQKKDLEKSSKVKMVLNKTKSKAEKGLA